MKKTLIVTLALVFVLGLAGTAFANPYSDVPAGHWAYKAVNDLQKAGVMEGAGGKFMGNQTLTRYEIAAITARAMAKADKADAAQKATIDKLAVEFSKELNDLGVRVAKLEKQGQNIKLTAQLRQRAEKTEGSDELYKTRLRIFMTAGINEDFTFKGRLAQESKAGKANDNLQVDQAYVTGKALGLTEVSVGRMPMYLGKGMIMDSSGNWDGVRVGFDVGDVKFMTAWAKKLYAGAKGAIVTKDEVADKKDYNLDGDKLDVAVPVYDPAVVPADERAFAFAQASYAFDKTFDMTASYFADEHKKNYETTSFALGYTGIQDFTVTGEYGKNDVSDAKGYMAKVKYLGANQAKVGSYGIWVGYRNAEAGFDPNGYTTLDLTDASATKAMNDIKSMEYGIEYTVMKNGVFTLQYNPAKVKSTDADNKFAIAYFIYNF